MRHLLILMVVLSIAFAVLFAFPNWRATVLLSIAATLLLVALTACVVYGTGQLRAFCIGALFPAVLVWIAVDCAFVVLTFTTSRDRYDRIIEGLDDFAGTQGESDGVRWSTRRKKFASIDSIWPRAVWTPTKSVSSIRTPA